MRQEGDGRSSPRWRAILEARWRIRLQEVTELSLAYHAATPDGDDGRQARRLLRRADPGAGPSIPGRRASRLVWCVP